MPEDRPTLSARMAALLDGLTRSIEEAEVLDAPADKLADAVRGATQRRGLADLLSGTFLGHPLHPLAVTVPIGAWSTAAVLDALRMRDGARAATGVGLLVAPVAVLSGLSDWSTTSGPSRRVGFAHAGFNVAMIALYAASWWARKRGHHGTGVLLSIPAAALIGASGWLGGHLIYARGVGVDVTTFEEHDRPLVDVAAEADIRTGQMTRVEVGGQPVLLTRSRDGRVVALSDRCTHRGAPLHEGSCDGEVVQCPWHGSVFGLAEGEVRAGPATRPQSVHVVEVVDGRVLVGGGERP